MNPEMNAEARPEVYEISEGDEMTSRDVELADYPFYIVPRPPIPGKTGWSVTAW